MEKSVKKSVDKETILKDLIEKSKTHYRRAYIGGIFTFVMLFNACIIIPLNYFWFSESLLSSIIVSEIICFVVVFLFVNMLSRGNKNKLLSVELLISLQDRTQTIRIHTDSLEDTEFLLASIEEHKTIESYKICV